MRPSDPLTIAADNRFARRGHAGRDRQGAEPAIATGSADAAQGAQPVTPPPAEAYPAAAIPRTITLEAGTGMLLRLPSRPPP